MLAETLSLLIALALSALIVTQVIVPAVRGRALLPLFRRSGVKAESRLERARTSLDEAFMEAEAEATEEKVEKLRKGSDQ